MATSTRSRTTKKPKVPLRHRLKTYNFFLILAVLLGMAAGVLMVKTFYRGEPLSASRPLVALGAIEYDFKDGKAVKKNDPLITSLRVFLEAAAAKDCDAVHNFMEPAQYTVVSATQDRKQVLLGYGCGDLSARMFAVYENDAWKFLSPTNQFDITTNAPLCSHVEKNGIKKEIAPVCYIVSGSTIQYKVR